MGTPWTLSRRAPTSSIEIAHILGLIHEHLRSDRDKFIARNPSCSSRDAFKSIYDGWIDVTNVAITDDTAELLTAYHFDSIMHYDFALDRDGDGAIDCSTWVRIATCPGGDLTSSACNGRFSSSQLTARDIEGLHKLYARVSNDPEVQTFTADNVRHRGKHIDRCLQGLPFRAGRLLSRGPWRRRRCILPQQGNPARVKHPYRKLMG